MTATRSDGTTDTTDPTGAADPTGAGDGATPPAPAPALDIRPSSWLRIGAVARRHALVLRRSPHRLFEIVVWPIVDVLLFGSLGVYVGRQGATADAAAGAQFLLAGILLFHIIYQVQISVATGFLEETWSRNLLNLMTTPLREIEYGVGVALFGLVKLVVGIGVVTATAVGFFAFNLFDLGWGLVPVAAILMGCGWTISLYVIGFVLRFGQSAEVLAWGILFVIMPLSGVFYPVEALPPLLQPVALALPTTHAFAAARTVLTGAPLPWDELASALAGLVAFAAGGVAFLARMLRTFRRRGFITRFS
jgi:ABC-2 type transport system permease protein